MVSHHAVHLDNLGDYALACAEDGDLKQKLSAIKSDLRAKELFYLATCNRVLYLILREEKLSIDEQHMLFGGQDLDLVTDFSGEEAVRHLFEVASSIHSLVVGEREILKQLRDAYAKQRTWGTTGDMIRLVMQQTVRTAKRIYARTRIGDKPVSVVSLAVKQFMKHQLPTTSRIAIVGAGETIQLMLKHLTKKGYRNFVIFNRSLDRGQAVATKIGATAYSLEEISSYDQPVDCVIACTGASEATVRTGQVPQQWVDDNLVWIDLGVPQDIDSVIAGQAGERYIGLAALKNLASENLAFRRKEVDKAEHIIVDSIGECRDALMQRNIEVAFRDIPNEIKQVRKKAISEVFANDFEELDDNSREIVERMLTYMEKKCISIPMKVARQIAIESED